MIFKVFIFLLLLDNIELMVFYLTLHVFHYQNIFLLYYNYNIINLPILYKYLISFRIYHFQINFFNY